MEPLVAKSDLAGYLRAHGVTPTRQRLIISEVLFDKRQHVSAEQILRRVAQKDKSVSRATVYNTLNLFVDKMSIASPRIILIFFSNLLILKFLLAIL